MSRPTGAADDLLELLWDNGLPALRTTPSHFPPPFQPFTCSAAGSSRVHELDKQRRHDAVPPAIMEDDDDVVVGGLGGIPVHDDEDDDDAVPWLHCPVIDDGDSDTAPLPPEFCAGLMMSGYSALHTAEPTEPESEPHLTATSSGIIARPQSNAAPAPSATRGAPPDTQQPKPSGGGEGVMNFTFFSRPLHWSHASAAAASPGKPLESTVVQTAAASRLRSTPLFSEQRMAWLQPPKEPRAAAATPHAPPPAPTPHATTDGHRRHVEAEAAAAATVTQHRLRPDARTRDATTTSSVCSGNGDGSQARPSSHQHTGECSVSQDEDADDEPSAGRRSAARGTKRSRTAEVHNLSERRRRDRINEKMRALQELIPNCNKIDKASMLEEAIEYLKTLQLQVQMMSMGSTGLCVPVPPTMLMQMQMPVVPTPMAAAAAAAPFPQLGGMGLGFGGMALGFAGGATQFPCPVMPGAPPMAMPPVGAKFGMPPFPHVLHGAAAPVEQREAAGPARPAPGGVGAGDHRRPPVPVALPVPQGDPKLQRPKQT